MTLMLFRVVDVETSGKTRPEAEVCELGWTDVIFNTETAACEIHSPDAMLFSITRPMPPEASAVHHLTDDDLKGLPLAHSDDFRQFAHAAFRRDMPDLKPCSLVAHNAAFEAQWFSKGLRGDLDLICTMKAARRVWPEAPGFSNSVLRYWRKLPVNHRLAMPPHRAGPDSYVTAHLLADLLKTESVDDLIMWSGMADYYPTLPIGKHKGMPWGEVPHDYLRWMTNQPDMDADIKAAAREQLNIRQGIS